MIPENSIICFKQDTKERKRFFKAASFAHPAKMILGLQIYLIEHYTKPGDTILDPMAGSGTILIACTLGRNVVLVELEDKFVKMQQDNYEKIKSLGPMLGYTLGEATILQGDARCLDGLLADNILFSPPYAEVKQDDTHKPEYYWDKVGGIGHKEKMTPKDPSNISNLSYGEISAVISSPPYAEAQEGGGIAKKGYQGPKHTPTDLIGKRSYMPSQHGKTKGQIGNLPYGKADAVITSPPYADIEARDRSKDKSYREDREKTHAGGSVNIMKGYQADAVITSPPYEGINTTGKADSYNGSHGPHSQVQIQDYRESNDNIGNLKSENYLQAMLQVYRQCHKVLKEKGLMILVVKNFIRDKKIIRLDLDTIKICEKAEFNLKESLKRKLTQQSFWRTIYHNKYPDVPKIEYEDVLIFQRVALFKEQKR